MARKYSHIGNFEKEILELKGQGLTHKEVGQQLGFTKEQVTEFFKRYRRKQRKIATGIELKKKGRPSKNIEVTEGMKLKQQRERVSIDGLTLNNKNDKIEYISFQSEKKLRTHININILGFTELWL